MVIKNRETDWRFVVVQPFRFGGRGYRVGDVLDRKRLSIGPRRLQRLLDEGRIERRSEDVRTENEEGHG